MYAAVAWVEKHTYTRERNTTAQHTEAQYADQSIIEASHQSRTIVRIWQGIRPKGCALLKLGRPRDRLAKTGQRPSLVELLERRGFAPR
jgi:hypothetical protein